jgi:hypothetical protein
LNTLNYTAREGGELLRRAANTSAQVHLPGDGWRFFDIRHEFPDAWQLFRSFRADDKEDWPKPLKLHLTRQMFPFIPGGRDISIDKMAIVFGATDGAPCECRDIADCPCRRPCGAAEREIDFVPGGDDEHEEHEEAGPDERRQTDVRCFAEAGRPGLYCGVFDARLGPLGVDSQGAGFELRFPAGVGRLEHMFLLCRYRADSRHGCER